MFLKHCWVYSNYKLTFVIADLENRLCKKSETSASSIGYNVHKQSKGNTRIGLPQICNKCAINEYPGTNRLIVILHWLVDLFYTYNNVYISWDMTDYSWTYKYRNNPMKALLNFHVFCGLFQLLVRIQLLKLCFAHRKCIFILYF